MMKRAGNLYPRVIFALPALQPPSVRHSASSSGPAARWIAPSTPPPPSSERFAAFTMASTCKVVMSATRMSTVVVPTGKVRRGAAIRSVYTSHAKRGRDEEALRPLGLRLGTQIDGAPLADILEMLIEETQRRLAAAFFQHLEEIEIRTELRSGRQLLERRIERDAVH